jgi:hypothetical protein
MAGGKETPRQKMIGMMYLVLTALLALNVSKQILDAFVAIEDNIQRGTSAQMDAGDASYRALKGEIAATPKNADGLLKIKEINYFLKKVEMVDKEASEIIHFIDKLKLDLLKAAGENTTTVSSTKEKEVILWSKYDPNKASIIPMRLNLAAVESKDNFDVPMQVLVGTDINSIKQNGSGMQLWNKYNDFRRNIIQTCGSYKKSKNNFSVSISKSKESELNKNLNKGMSYQDLRTAIEKLIKNSPNKPNKEDVNTLVGLYQDLTKVEIADHHEEKNNIHWLGRTFDHAPLVGAIASLSSLQNEVMGARAKAIAFLKEKVSTGEFSFNKIQELVSGPGVASEGEEVELMITMAAYDSDNNPEVTSSTGSIVVKNGIGYLKTKVGSSDMKISGTVMIKNRSQVPFSKPWSWDIKVAKSAGSISIPAYSVLFRDYPNFLVPVAVGIVGEAQITGAAVRKTTMNGQTGYIINPTGNSVSLSIMGKDGKGNPKRFGPWTYKVKPVPTPQLQTLSAPKSQNTRLKVGYTDGIIDATFTVVDYSITIGNELKNVKGDVIGAAQLAAAKAGRDVAITLNCVRVGSSGAKIKVKGSLTVN